MGKSRANLSDLVDSDFKGTLIITGFIASDARGVQTTLGRNGSDFSGSIFGACSMPRRSTSGRTSTASSRPIRAGCPMQR